MLALGIEYTVKEWLKLRGGIESTFLTNAEKDKNEARKLVYTEQETRASCGLGIEHKGFELDATVGGLILGGDDNFFSRLGLACRQYQRRSDPVGGTTRGSSPEPNRKAGRTPLIVYAAPPCSPPPSSTCPPHAKKLPMSRPLLPLDSGFPT